MSELSTPLHKLLNFSARLLAVLFFVAIFMVAFPEQAHHLLLLIGLAMAFHSLRILKRYGDLQHWSLEKAKIESLSEVIDEQSEGNAGLRKYVYPVIKYHYTIGDKIYQNDTVSLEKQNIWCEQSNIWGEPLKESDKWWSALKIGYELSAYSNPKKPEDSVLIRRLKNSRRSHHIAILLGGILIVCLWLLVILLKI